VSLVKKATTFIVITAFSLAILIFLSVSTQTVLAQDTSYDIQSVDHQVEVMYSGQVVIRDTVHVGGQLTGDFLIGFPYKYGSSVLKGIAYDTDNVFQVSLGVQLANRTGFYFAKINFPQSAPQVFTVVFILSNSLLSRNLTAGVFSLDFPAYPSVVKDVGICSVTITFPEEPPIINVAKSDGNVSTTSFVKNNLPAFTYSPAFAEFAVSSGSLRIINIQELNRQIITSPAGDITASDTYRLTNNSPISLDSVKISLPADAADVVTRDEFGRILTTGTLTSVGDTRFVNVTFISALALGQSTHLTTEYSLPSVSSEQAPTFTLDFKLFPDFDYYVDTASVTFMIPEGARFTAPQVDSVNPSSSLVREVFQETLTARREGVSKVDYTLSEDVMHIAYNYNPLWLSFRPTVWVWTLAVVGAVVVAVWRRPKTAAPMRIAAPKAAIGLSPDHVRDFTEAYNEKTRLSSELKVLEERAQKGRIPRRRYKVQRRTLETRFDTISRNIVELKRVFRSAGGVYSDLIRQLDVAEAELGEVETGIRNSEIRHRRGELPLEAYKKSIVDYQRRKEKAEATINGILLRLREELH
jgi:hypothetical protein